MPKIKMYENCEKIYNWALNCNPNPTSITKISDASGVPRMSVAWLLENHKNKGDKSVMAIVALRMNVNYRVDARWNRENKFRRTKDIIFVSRK